MRLMYLDANYSEIKRNRRYRLSIGDIERVGTMQWDPRSGYVFVAEDDTTQKQIVAFEWIREKTNIARSIKRE